MQKEMVLMIGLPFAGKSTYVQDFLKRAPGYQVIEGSTIVQGFKEVNVNITNQTMDRVYYVQKIIARAHMERQLPIIVDERNLTLESIFIWRQIAENSDYRTTAVIIDTPLEICLKRAEDNGRTADFLEHIRTCAEQLNELKLMLGFKHQNILSTYKVIKPEEKLDEIL